MQNNEDRSSFKNDYIQSYKKKLKDFGMYRRGSVLYKIVKQGYQNGGDGREDRLPLSLWAPC